MKLGALEIRQMNIRRITALAMRIVLQFRRDRRTVALIVGVPIVVLSLLAYLINLGAGGLAVGVVVEGDSSMAQLFLVRLRRVEVLDIREMSAQEADKQVHEGKLDAVLVLQGTAPTTASSPFPKIDVTIEGSSSRTRPMLMQGLSQAMQSPADVHVRYLHAGPEYGSIDYFAPTLIALFAFVFVYLLTAVGFLRERTLGTFERLLASPLTKVEMVLGYMAGFSLFALLQSTIILLFTVYVIRIHYAGNLFIVFVIVAILTLGSVNLGIFLSTYARNELQAVQFMPMVIVPQALLGGVFWPIQDMHVVFQWISHLLPLTYANFALQAVMIKGQGILEPGVAADIGALVLFAAVMVVLASVGLRRASA